ARRTEVQRRCVHVSARVDRDPFGKIAGGAELGTEVPHGTGLGRGERGLGHRKYESERGERHEFPHGSLLVRNWAEFSCGQISRKPTNMTDTPSRFVNSRIPDAPVNATVPPAATMRTPAAITAF